MFSIRQKKIVSASHTRLLCMNVTIAEGSENKQVSCHNPWTSPVKDCTSTILCLKHWLLQISNIFCDSLLSRGNSGQPGDKLFLVN